jgi:hypothetical protein
MVSEPGRAAAKMHTGGRFPGIGRWLKCPSKLSCFRQPTRLLLPPVAKHKNIF